MTDIRPRILLGANDNLSKEIENAVGREPWINGIHGRRVLLRGHQHVPWMPGCSMNNHMHSWVLDSVARPMAKIHEWSPGSMDG